MKAPIIFLLEQGLTNHHLHVLPSSNYPCPIWILEDVSAILIGCDIDVYGPIIDSDMQI